MPLSEEEQRILHEMEQKLYEHDRGFVARTRSEGPRSLANRTIRWSIAVFIAGFVILLLSFRDSVLLGTFGFFVMLIAVLLFERSARQVFSGRGNGNIPTAPSAPRGRALSDEFSLIGRRFRSRFLRDR